MKIAFVDLHAQYLTIKQEIDAAIATVIAESAYIRGRHVWPRGCVGDRAVDVILASETRITI